MGKKDEKTMSLEEFKKEVYKRIGTLEGLDETSESKEFKAGNPGCMGFLAGYVVRFAGRKAREYMKYEELSAKADVFLAQPENKDLICANLDATVRLPVDAAYKLTPVLYDLAKKDEEKLPLDSNLFAIICRKITAAGVENYCGTENKKGRKAKDKKPENE